MVLYKTSIYLCVCVNIYIYIYIYIYRQRQGKRERNRQTDRQSKGNLSLDTQMSRMFRVRPCDFYIYYPHSAFTKKINMKAAVQ